MDKVIVFVIALAGGFIVGTAVGQGSMAGKANELPIEKVDGKINYDVPLTELGKKLPNGKYLYSNYHQEKFVAR